MTTQRELVQSAVDHGLLPGDAQLPPSEDSGSWVVWVLMLLGSFLVAALGLVFLALLSWRMIFHPPGAFVFALALMVGAVWWLRQGPGVFAAQLAVTLLFVGQGLWLVGWDGSGRLALTSLLVCQLLALWLVPVPWVRRVLGGVSTWTALTVVLWSWYGATPADTDVLGLLWRFPLYLNLWLVSALWAAWCMVEVRQSGRRSAVALSSWADGAGVALVCATLVGGYGFTSWWWLWRSRQGSADVDYAGTAALFHFHWTIAVQMAFVAAGAACLARLWRGAQPPVAGQALGLAGLIYAVLLLACWVVPDVGVLALIGSVALGTGRRRLLWLVLLGLLAQLSGFYYALQWPLAHKALLLAALGGALGVALWGMHRRTRLGDLAAPTGQGVRLTGQRVAPWIMLGGAVLAIALVHWDVRTKEQVIAHGQRIYLPLQPRDPRSLMQGDYMALRFDLGAEATRQLHETVGPWSLQSQILVVARLDARGVATVLHVAQEGERPAAGEVLLPLKRLKGGWTLVTDAFFFPEGRGTPLNAARFGEFRVLPGGRALLVGLADAALQRIEPAKATLSPSPQDAAATVQ